MVVKDGGQPPRTAATTIEVNVTRNMFAPEFQNFKTRVDIPETLPAGTVVVRVSAKDKDRIVSYFLLPFQLMCNYKAKCDHFKSLV